MGQQVLIATLGSEAQVVTLALDLLLQRGYTINKLIVLHTDPSQEPIASSFGALLKELDQYPPYQHLQHEEVCFRDAQGRPLPDVVTPEDMQAVFRTIFETLKRVKQEGHTVHLSAAGGRKAMSSYALLSAQFLFDENDCFWNLWSAPELLSGRQMHAARPDEALLIRLPIPPWRMGLLEKERFISELPPALTEVLELVARGKTNREIAAIRVTEEGTARSQVEDLIRRVTDWLEYERNVNRRDIIREFFPYFELIDALGYPTHYGQAGKNP